VSSGSLTLLGLTVRRDPALSVGRDGQTRDEILGNATSLVALLVALVPGTVFSEAVNYKALLLLVLSGPVERLVRRSWRRHPERPVTSDEPRETTADVR